MMRLWRTSYARQSRLESPAALSVLAHTILIGLCVIATRPPDSMAENSLANRVVYIPPPDRPVSSSPAASREAVHYISFGEGIGAGPGPIDLTARGPVKPAERSKEPGPQPADSVSAIASPEPIAGNTDSIFTILEVDSAVVRSQSSAAPAYPLDLLNKHIEGFVTARYVVDTTGFADVASLAVVQATNPGFETAVRTALPYMRFSPAKIGKTKVRQLVEQSFTFRISVPASSGVKP